MKGSELRGERAAHAELPDGARKRAAVETYVHNEDSLRRTARRYSICADDADDALQRGLEILLRKAPSDDPRELIRWTQTVVKHEALAVRRERERILSGPAAARLDPGREDWVARLPAENIGPAERAERQEEIDRSREALRTLKPQELRALSLLAEGYSYAEIGEITGFSHTKINRSLAEGRERYRKLIASSEDGSRCAELRPRISAFCDGETGPEETTVLREHLRACPSCRVTLRAYRAAPAAAAALAPALPASRSLLERAHDALASVTARFGSGPGSDATLSQVAASGGARGAGVAALAKVLAVCTATAGGAAACVATGIVPAPLPLEQTQRKAPVLEQKIDPVLSAEWNEAGTNYEPATPVVPTPEPQPPATPKPDPVAAAAPAPEPVPASSGGAVEFTPPPEVSAAPAASAASGGGAVDSAAGEFGP